MGTGLYKRVTFLFLYFIPGTGVVKFFSLLFIFAHAGMVERINTKGVLDLQKLEKISFEYMASLVSVCRSIRIYDARLRKANRKYITYLFLLQYARIT